MGGVWDAKRGVWSVGYVDGFLGETQGVFRSASHIWFCFLDVMMLELHLSMRIISQFLNFHVIFHILTEKNAETQDAEAPRPRQALGMAQQKRWFSPVERFLPIYALGKIKLNPENKQFLSGH